MSAVSELPSRTLADLMDRLGRVPLDRIRCQPAPGTATERDVLEIARCERRSCELVDGVLVEKPMGYRESILAALLIGVLGDFVRRRNLGFVSGEQGMMRLFPGLVRIPDVAFASWDRFPNGRLSEEAIPSLAPDLAVEVLSESNTPAEMRLKIGEYFSAGVKRVWLVDPESRTVTVHSPSADTLTLGEADTLDAAPVLPGFTLVLSELFAELDRHR